MFSFCSIARMTGLAKLNFMISRLRFQMRGLQADINTWAEQDASAALAWLDGRVSKSGVPSQHRASLVVDIFRSLSPLRKRLVHALEEWNSRSSSCKSVWPRSPCNSSHPASVSDIEMGGRIEAG